MRESGQFPSDRTDAIDYVETADVTQVHAAIRRERGEPAEGTTPAPVWLLSLCGAALLCAGFYLGMYNGGFDGSVFDWYTRPLPGANGSAPQSGAGEVAQADTPAQIGQKVFKLNCATCHQETGLGIAGQFPPLAKSEYVNGSPKRLSMILLKGLQGPVKVLGATYSAAVMPAWEKQLNDAKIAEVLTYVRQAWGNSAGEITPEQISTARKEFAGHVESWKEPDLLAVPADATLPGGAGAAAAPPQPGK